MEKSELTVLINHLFETQRQQFHSIQELTLAIAAIQRLMEDDHPNFQAEHRAKIRDLRRGELGQKIAHDIAAFEQALSLAKASLL
jgi:hypothetical protein